MTDFSALRLTVKGHCLLDAPMSQFTTYRIGGPADCVLLPSEGEDILKAMRFCREREIPLLVMGNGSNVLVRDGGIRGLVIKINEHMSGYNISGNSVTVLPGTILAHLARDLSHQGLAGLSWAAGIPASVGGASVMNAGAFGHFFYEVLSSVKVITPDLEFKTYTKDELAAGYRHTALQSSGEVVVEVNLEMEPGDPAELGRIVEEKLAYRRDKQPLDYPSCGSVFKNPEGDHAGRLSEAAGMHGVRIGNACVSQKHGNFIINLGGATARDVLALIDKVRGEVKEQFGVTLEPEVRIIGEEP